MYGVTLAHAFSFKPSSKLRSIQMFSTIGITSIFSWPFALVLASVLFIHDVVQVDWNKARILEFVQTLIEAGARVVSFLVIPLYGCIQLLGFDGRGGFRGISAVSSCAAKHCHLQRLFRQWPWTKHIRYGTMVVLRTQLGPQLQYCNNSSLCFNPSHGISMRC
jgi:hypothetical protein